MKMKKGRNRLRDQKSPYLLQHADNPVDWRPWDDQAFAEARENDKPIFLSIGYSTCHWCHVMERESFEDPEVADLMNEAFVSIKVDREERPDIDDVYMTVCQILTGSGGWPLTIVMTPDKKPFFAGTYIPKTSRFGRLGMLELIPRIQKLWREQRHEAERSAENIVDALNKSSFTEAGKSLTANEVEEAYRQLRARYDSRFAGFDDAPKFPIPHRLSLLLRIARRNDNDQATAMVAETLRAMRRGGIFDQVGFGFHRYSTDRSWLVPHFEKMLYDQALLALAYLDAYQATGETEFAETARQIFTYVLGDMTDEEGGFYSAEDADSEGEEGRFYLWTWDELHRVLTPEEAAWAVKVFGVMKEGNFLDEATHRRNGANILHWPQAPERVAEDLNMTTEQLAERLQQVRGKLLAARTERPRPHKDDKILTDWNGLMIAALARGAQVLGEPRYAEAARRAADFIRRRLTTQDGRLVHRYRDGEAAITGYVNDYAFLVWGLLELYEACFDVEHLKWALSLQQQMNDRFWDEKNGGFFLTPDDGEKLPVRKKDLYDGALPSGNSVSLLNLLRLARISADPDLEERAERQIAAFATTVRRSPAEFTQFLTGILFALGPSFEVVIAGDSAGAKTEQMLRVVRGVFAPNKVLLLRPTETERPPIVDLAPYTERQTADGKPLAYICKQFRCELPLDDAERVAAALSER